MAEIHHLGHGWVTPTVSYILSVLGSLLGLICAVRLRSAPSTGWRVWWLGLAAVAIGGTGIWTMHFVAMLGFSVVGTPIRYDVSLTAASAIIAVATVGVGLSIALLGSGARHARILVGGILAGLGVAAMHYTGMAAMRLDGDIDYGTTLVGLSVGIAVVAATVALWLAVTVHKPVAIMVSALIMGVAVNGMHFTGMSAMSVQLQNPGAPLAGATASTLLIPIGLAVVFGILGLVYALIAAPTEEDRAGLAFIAARQAEAETAASAGTPRQKSSGTLWGQTRRATQGQAPGTTVPLGKIPQPRSPEGPSLGQALRMSQGQEPDGSPAEPGVSPAPGATPPDQGKSPRRMPTNGSSWTYRDRTNK